MGERRTSWRRWPFRVAVALAVALTGGLVWGHVIEPRWLEVVEHEVAWEGLPAGWEGAELALIADLQVGMWGANEETMEEAVARVVARRPAAALIAGDFLYKAMAPGDGPAPEIDRAVEIVRPMVEAGIPTYAVLGNHDYELVAGAEARPLPGLGDALETRLKAAGVRVLRNEAVRVPAPGGRGQGLPLVGVDSLWAGLGDVEASRRALRALGTRHGLWLMHNPDHARALRAGEAPLALAGHTHGGQVRLLPWSEGFSWLDVVREDEVRVAGWVRDEALVGGTGNQLYINRGLGFSVLPVRWGARPELTFLRLTARGGGAGSR